MASSSKSSIRDLAVGATTLAGVIGLGVLMLIFGYAPQFTKSSYVVQIHMDQSGQLNPESPVKLAGIDVGRVRAVEFAPGGPSEGVVVTADIDGNRRIPEGSSVKVTSSIFGGSGVANIVPPPPAPDDAPTYLPTDGSAQLEGRVAGLLTDLEAPLASLTGLNEDLAELSSTWNEVGVKLNQLLGEQDAATVEPGDALANVSTLVQRLDARVAEAKEVIEGARGLLADPEIREDLKTTLRNTAEVSEAAGDMVRFSRGALEDISERVVGVADELSAAVGEARGLLDKASEGEGSVAKLLNDPSLLNNLNDASQRLQKLLDEARLLVQKWKAEGLPVQF